MLQGAAKERFLGWDIGHEDDGREPARGAQHTIREHHSGNGRRWADPTARCLLLAIGQCRARRVALDLWARAP